MRVRNGRFAEIIGPWPDSESEFTQRANRNKPLLFKIRIGQSHVRRQCLYKMPVTLSAQSRQYRLILWRAKFNKITDPPSAPAPLFPVTHADTSAQPMIHFNYVVVLHPAAEIIHPSMDVEAKGCVP